MKKTITFLAASVVLFFVLMLCNILFGGTNGMGICFLLFFAVNPLFFVIEGILCGLTIKKHWWLPLASALIYLVSNWILLDMGETAFILYAGMYLGVGAVAMLGSYFGRKWMPKQENRL